VTEPADVHELAAAYVLDALDAGDAATLARHLTRCTVCREELESLHRAAAALAHAPALPPPRPELRQMILARVRAERDGKIVPLWRRHALVGSTAVAGIAACAAVALGVWTWSLSHSLRNERAARRADARALAVVASPDAQRFALHGGRGALIVTPERQAVLLVAGLPRLPTSRTYEVWVVTGGHAERAGLFAGAGTRSLVSLSRPVPTRAAVAVSIEPRGGSRAPTGRMILGAQTS
jgi:anti-sigma-K factor RskA